MFIINVNMFTIGQDRRAVPLADAAQRGQVPRVQLRREQGEDEFDLNSEFLTIVELVD